MGKIELLESKVKKLEQRNDRVDSDKAWETSLTRKAVIFMLTYLAISLYFVALNLPDPFFNAFVPSIAFAISTLSLPFFKKLWIENAYRK